MKPALALAAAAFIAGCATLPGPSDRELASRIDSILARRALGHDALGVIDNLLAHEGALPPRVPPLARAILARPLGALDTAAFFDQAVPGALVDLAAAMKEDAKPGASIPARELLQPYLDELADAQRLLRAAARGPIDTGPLARELESRLPSARPLAALAGSLDAAQLERANRAFLEATAKFARAVRAAQGRIRFPGRAERFDSAIGAIVIGSPGDDRHAPAALILDPGGNDTYERARVSGGAISVIVDLAGNDRYEGSDLVLHGFAALLDFAGDDRYAAAGPGLGAAIAGASVIVDSAGNDSYDADLFGEGAAAFGIGAILDLAGDDSYRVRAGGQGFGMTAGLGLLWDRAGDDRYAAGGIADAFDRGGGVSFAQGAGLGGRTSLGGGIGILRDDAGNDRYEAEMFAQGVAYYFGAGLLWDRGGDDRYGAVRYAQGCGVHLAVGLLRDESGNDRYDLKVGVGQGMGLDQSVGLLYDGAGDDDYAAPGIAQGAATENGMGFMIDLAGANRFHASGGDRRMWGRAEWARALPSLGILLYEPGGSSFERAGKPEVVPATQAALGGPWASQAIEYEAEPAFACPSDAPALAPAPPLAAALDALLPGLMSGKSDARLFASIRERLTQDLRGNLATLPAGSFGVWYALGEALRCSLIAASEGEAHALWDEIERQLAADPAGPFTGPLLAGLRGRPAPPAQRRRILAALHRSPSCGIRALALRLGDAPDFAQAALASSCWREQAEALAALRRTGGTASSAVLPSFLERQ